MSIEEMAKKLQELGYSYGDIVTYAQSWECSVNEAIEKLIDLNMLKYPLNFLHNSL